MKKLSHLIGSLRERTHFYIIFFILIFEFIAVYHTTIFDLILLWLGQGHSNYVHGGLIFLLAIGFSLLKLYKSNIRLQIIPSYSFIAPILFFSLAWMVFSLGNIQLAQQIAIYGLFILLLLSLFGIQQFKYYLSSTLLILLAIPVWDYLGPTLRIISLKGVAALLSQTQILFLVEGFHITLANGQFHVDRGCSGLNQFISGLSISVFYCIINRTRIGYSTLIIVAGMILAMFGNIVRIFIIILSGYMTNMQHYFVTTDHVVLGWLIFSCFTFAYIAMLNKILIRYPNIVYPERDHTLGTIHDTKKQQLIFSGLVFLCLLSGPMIITLLDFKTHSVARQTLSLPQCIEKWCQHTDELTIDTGHRYIGYDQHAHAWYVKDDVGIRLDVYLYVKQTQGKEAVNNLNRLYNKFDWQFIKKFNSKLNNTSFNPETILLKSSNGLTVYTRHWYLTNEKHISNPLLSKLENIIGLLTGSPEVMVIILSLDTGWDSQKALHNLNDFSEKLNEITEINTQL